MSSMQNVAKCWVCRFSLNPYKSCAGWSHFTSSFHRQGIWASERLSFCLKVPHLLSRPLRSSSVRSSKLHTKDDQETWLGAHLRLLDCPHLAECRRHWWCLFKGYQGIAYPVSRTGPSLSTYQLLLRDEGEKVREKGLGGRHHGDRIVWHQDKHSKRGEFLQRRLLWEEDTEVPFLTWLRVKEAVMILGPKVTVISSTRAFYICSWSVPK